MCLPFCHVQFCRLKTTSFVHGLLPPVTTEGPSVYYSDDATRGNRKTSGDSLLNARPPTAHPYSQTISFFMLITSLGREVRAGTSRKRKMISVRKFDDSQMQIRFVTASDDNLVDHEAKNLFLPSSR
ncbi:hypothetical protein JTE90_017183 [Oedothorax gibbosus]|uniref:Uncharacterized protein n=1 Tax=Oedothorax gibbosus TaxID=931172 RepID=A0AAV6VA59_9ARAC|nr:hypothetical protein JTE90_017183 [Oedothorax gibbosus]